MVYSGLQLDEHVVHIDLNCLTNLFLKHHIDKTLVGCSSFLEIERHDLIAVELVVSDEGKCS